MTPILSHTEIAAPGATPEQWLLVLHGIYGSGRNWATIARRLVEARPEWGAVLVDLRLHGGSTGFSPPHTIEAAAADVDSLVGTLAEPVRAILGHSYGGKVALAYARNHGGGLRQVWVIDSTLEVREPSGSAWRLIEAVRSLPQRLPSRDALVEGLAPHGYAAPLASWLGMNLEREGSEFRWKLDWEGVEEMLRDYFRTDVWDVVENPPAGTAIHVVRATESNSLPDDAGARIEKAAAGGAATHLHELEGGHWINVDNPDAVVALLAASLPPGGTSDP